MLADAVTTQVLGFLMAGPAVSHAPPHNLSARADDVRSDSSERINTLFHQCSDSTRSQQMVPMYLMSQHMVSIMDYSAGQLPVYDQCRRFCLLFAVNHTLDLHAAARSRLPRLV